MTTRQWMMQYGVAVLLAVIMGLILGHIPLFKEAAVGKLRASNLVQFLAYGGAVAMIWLCGRRISHQWPGEWKRFAPVRALLLPVLTLFAVAAGYGVLSFLVDPFLGKPGKSVYNWVFVIGLVGASAWVIVTWVLSCAPLAGSAESSRRGRKQAA